MARLSRVKMNLKTKTADNKQWLGLFVIKCQKQRIIIVQGYEMKAAFGCEQEKSLKSNNVMCPIEKISEIMEFIYFICDCHYIRT